MPRDDARRLSASAQESLRRRAVRAVLSGRRQGEVAAAFGVSRQALANWLGAHRRGGLRSLKARPRGRPKGGSLNDRQAAVIVRLLRDRQPDQLHLPFYLWTREAVAQLIERRFALALSVWTVGRYLAAWGFTPQKPVRRAFERDPQAVKRWLKEDYPAIRARARREKAGIYWGDEMGLRSDHAAGRSYSPRGGETPVIPGTGRRFGCNMVSAITNRGKLYFMVFRGKFTAPVFLDFLKRLERQLKRRFYLIVDGHPVHRAKAVSRWLKEDGRKVRLFFLPGYSPELNPDELLNQDVKSNALGRRRARDQAELLQNVRGYLRGRQRRPQIVRNYFKQEHVRYAAA